MSAKPTHVDGEATATDKTPRKPKKPKPVKTNLKARKPKRAKESKRDHLKRLLRDYTGQDCSNWLDRA